MGAGDTGLNYREAAMCDFSSLFHFRYLDDIKPVSRLLHNIERFHWTSSFMKQKENKKEKTREFSHSVSLLGWYTQAAIFSLTINMLFRKAL